MGVTRRDFVAGCGGAAVAGLAMSEAHAQSAPPGVESLNAPLHPGAPTLIVRDLAGVARYYEEGIGLARIDADSDTVRLGAGGEVLIVLRKRPSAEREPPGLAGLYHTAFLVPGRADLGAWLRRAIEMKLPFDGAADHLVSESLYLSDPEGNGIEMYADRPRSGWNRSAGRRSRRSSWQRWRWNSRPGAAMPCASSIRRRRARSPRDANCCSASMRWTRSMRSPRAAGACSRWAPIRAWRRCCWARTIRSASPWLATSRP